MLPEVCNFGIATLLFIHSISIGFGVHDVLACCWQASQLLDQKVGKKSRLIFFFYGFYHKIFIPRSLRTLRSLAAPSPSR